MSDEYAINAVNTNFIKGRNNSSFVLTEPMQPDNHFNNSNSTTNENSRTSNNHFSFLKIKSSSSYILQSLMITYNNLSKHNSNLDAFDSKIIKKLIEKKPSEALSRLKDLEIQADETDHISSFYSFSKSLLFLRKILDYYEIFSLRLPVFGYLPMSNPIQEYYFWRKKNLEDLEFGNNPEEASKSGLCSINSSIIDNEQSKTHTRQVSELHLLNLPEESFLYSGQKSTITNFMRKESGLTNNCKMSLLNSSLASFRMINTNLLKHSKRRIRDFVLSDSASISVILNSNQKTTRSKLQNDESVSLISSQILLQLQTKRESCSRIADPINSQNVKSSPINSKALPSSKDKAKKPCGMKEHKKESVNHQLKPKAFNLGEKIESKAQFKSPHFQMTNLITKDKINQAKDSNCILKPHTAVSSNLSKNNYQMAILPVSSGTTNEIRTKSKALVKGTQIHASIKDMKPQAQTPSNQTSKRVEISITQPKKEKEKTKQLQKASINSSLPMQQLSSQTIMASQVTSKSKIQPNSLASQDQKKSLTKQKSQTTLTTKIKPKSGQRSRSNSLEKKPKKLIGSFHGLSKLESSCINTNPNQNAIHLKSKIINLCKDLKESNEILSKKLFQNPLNLQVQSVKQSQSRPMSKSRKSNSGKISKEKAIDKSTHTKSTTCISKSKSMKPRKQVIDLAKLEDSLEGTINEEQDDGQLQPSSRKTEVTRNLINTFDYMAIETSNSLFKQFDTENDLTLDDNLCSLTLNKKSKHKSSQTSSSISNLKTAKIVIDKSSSCKKIKEHKESQAGHTSSISAAANIIAGSLTLKQKK